MFFGRFYSVTQRPLLATGGKLFHHARVTLQRFSRRFRWEQYFEHQVLVAAAFHVYQSLTRGLPLHPPGKVRVMLDIRYDLDERRQHCFFSAGIPPTSLLVIVGAVVAVILATAIGGRISSQQCEPLSTSLVDNAKWVVNRHVFDETGFVRAANDISGSGGMRVMGIFLKEGEEGGGNHLGLSEFVYNFTTQTLTQIHELSDGSTGARPNTATSPTLYVPSGIISQSALMSFDESLCGETKMSNAINRILDEVTCSVTNLGLCARRGEERTRHGASSNQTLPGDAIVTSAIDEFCNQVTSSSNMPWATLTSLIIRERLESLPNLPQNIQSSIDQCLGAAFDRISLMIPLDTTCPISPLAPEKSFVQSVLITAAIRSCQAGFSPSIAALPKSRFLISLIPKLQSAAIE